MKKTYYLPIFLLLLIFSGCEKNISLDIPKYKSKVVVYSVLQSGVIPELSLSLSQSYYSYADTTGKPGFIDNARVIITDQNTNIKDTLGFDSSFKFYYGKHRIIAGHHYTANINYQGTVVTAETTVPMPVKIDHIDYVKIGYGIGPGISDTSYEFHIYFNDIPGEADNYTVTQDGQTDYSSFSSDAGLDGKQLEIIAYLNNELPHIVPFTVDFSVDNSTKQTADYLTNVYLQSGSANNPFSQPVIVESNINGGLGLFGARVPSPVVFVKVVK